MNQIKRSPIHSLGYDFIPQQFLPNGADEYYLRNVQNRSGIAYRQLNAMEIEILVRNRNQSDDWNKLLVSDEFNPELVKNCKFFGLVRIGKLEACYLEYHNLRMPVGIYNSTIISCDLGDNIVIDNVHYLSHYILGNEVILVNVNEMSTTNHAKFGNGIVKDGEDPGIRIWMELCNENGGRKVIPFSGMLPGDAWIWSKFRTDTDLQEKLVAITQNSFDTRRGYYGKVGDRSIIKNCLIIKDVWIGSDAYIKGANKLKNLTIHSSPEASSQVGEGCELVNGIISEGCRIFYGVKAVRFAMASHSQLKYGARLINSYLGNNSTISCCEVLNSLIFPSHEQHHNNSFLCASLLNGQSNMAAGATVGSNHNSRGADGELIAGRGFWPGLCVSVKHNSRFATFNIVAKGDYPAELDIPLPFSLISHQVHLNRIQVMPAYWFLYNLYALARNAWKYKERDKRIEKIQPLEFDYLAPDSVQEMVDALPLLELAVGKSFIHADLDPSGYPFQHAGELGRKLLESKDPRVDSLLITVEGWENSKRPVEIIKVSAAWQVFRRMIEFYAVQCVVQYGEIEKFGDWESVKGLLPSPARQWNWKNVGGQLIPAEALNELISKLKSDQIQTWTEAHALYENANQNYNHWKCTHSLQCLLEMRNVKASDLCQAFWDELLNEAVNTRQWLSDQVYLSRKKDYANPFRNMVYDSAEERDLILGSLETNSFLLQERQDCEAFINKVKLR
ncbi:hypothetical protein ADIS_2983 [Lunatimonas lonarensis]|uniref:DUF4954 domain-containing protein n=1 Tax=Lunatimonas lonarensis TaxID=1232681 RepID=R7ZR45_9BACT|nr:DUF4954 family protein [Lunatimonas lonarensis]EON76533.1 hypothetical protein ADIS_2983 [Lunatimonas lonarensis]